MLGRIVAVAGIAAAGWLWRRERQRRRGEAVSTLDESIEIDVPVSTAYNQWTQFEAFPRFMDGVLEVRQVDDAHLHWRARIAGRELEWDAEITEQRPDERIAWRSTSGPRNSGVVEFEKTGDNRCRVHLHMEYEPPGVLEDVGAALGAVHLQASGNLRRFRDFLQRRGAETGAWRGEVPSSGRGDDSAGAASLSSVTSGAAGAAGASGGGSPPAGQGPAAF